MDTQDNAIARYKDKILGIRNYEADKEEFYPADFMNHDTLYDFLWEASTGESDFTPAGIAFIKEFYNFEALGHEYRLRGKQLPPNGYGKTEAERIERFVNYLNNVVPMETSLFIAESQWKEASNNADKPSINDLDGRLLPPK